MHVSVLNFACEGTLEVSGKQRTLSSRFGAIDHEEVRNIDKGKRRRSQDAKLWARNAFEAWRDFGGHSKELSIEDKFEQDLKRLVELLSEFILQTRKKDGSLYPPGSIQGFLRAFNRLIVARQAQSLAKTSVQFQHVNIFKDVHFQCVKLARDEACTYSLDAGLGKESHGWKMEWYKWNMAWSFQDIVIPNLMLNTLEVTRCYVTEQCNAS